MSLSLLRRMKWPARPLQMRLRTWLGLIAVIAVMLAVWTQHRQDNVPWHKAGGMIGWTEARMVGALGQPKQSIDREFPHPEAQAIRPTPVAGEFRTLFFENVDGLFVAWLKSEQGTYTCFRSTWVTRGCYYLPRPPPITLAQGFWCCSVGRPAGATTNGPRATPWGESGN